MRCPAERLQPAAAAVVAAVEDSVANCSLGSAVMSGVPVSIRDSPCPVGFLDCGDLEGRRFVSDSRDVRRGDIFVALRGRQTDGHQWAAAAVELGAAGLIVEQPLPELAVPQAIVLSTRQVWSWLALAQEGFPQRDLRCSGLTGTNGKSTVAWLLRGMLRQSGVRTGLIGTIEYHDGQETRPAGLTTPDPPVLARLLRQMRQAGTTDCEKEISSHALEQQRCSSLQLAVAAITNVTHDHLDYHGTFENYLQAKLQIAALLHPEAPLLVGFDDVALRVAVQQLKDVRVLGFGFGAECPFSVSIEEAGADGQRLRLKLQSGELSVSTSLPGRHNALNILLAAGMAEVLGLGTEQIRAGVEQSGSVPGRFERIDSTQPFQVYVDYAHTPDGIRRVIEAAREMCGNRVLVVFGAGGERDREKRPLMAAAATLADEVIVTSDNARSESPAAIVDEICSGFPVGRQVQRVLDREAAIRTALQSAAAGDVVLILGRGHEQTQWIGTRQIAFDDRRVTTRLLRELSSKH
ncbi:MAG: UDP-N-acetylmuramoyl-L-alanyl-D-glutamate--2,6-diaminopimelate ligase [Planctomyces sp.]